VATKVEQHAAQLAAVGHPIRLTILRFVVQGGPAGTSAGDIQAQVDVPASTLSHHLKKLVTAGLLSARTEGTYRYYAPEFSSLRRLTDYLWEDCCKRGNAKCC
jgi:ArsR family transcriptional regulator, arsenate/arsenite/antimonite-responsive transcriptional repressor